jgi:hypothetical protein
LSHEPWTIKHASSIKHQASIINNSIFNNTNVVKLPISKIQKLKNRKDN